MLIRHTSDALSAWIVNRMSADEALLNLAVGAQIAWRHASSDMRRDALEKISLVEILLVPPGSEDSDLWLLPSSVAKYIVLDHGCREEGRRRGHHADAPIDIATVQALALREFRADLKTALDMVRDWPSFMKALRQEWEKRG